MSSIPPSSDAPPPEATPSARSRQVRLLLVGVALAALAALLWPRSEGSTAPGGFLVDDGGRPIPLGERLGDVTLVHFWATWCPPCLDEVPALAQFHKDLRPTGLSVAMIAVDDDPEQVASFLGGGGGEVLFDPDWKVARRFGTDKLPETYLVVDGVVAHKFVGATDWADPGVRRIVEEALRERSI